MSKYRNKLTRHFRRAAAIARTIEADIDREFDEKYPPAKGPYSYKSPDPFPEPPDARAPCTVIAQTIQHVIPISRELMLDVAPKEYWLAGRPNDWLWPNAAPLPPRKPIGPLLWKASRRAQRQKS